MNTLYIECVTSRKYIYQALRYYHGRYVNYDKQTNQQTDMRVHRDANLLTTQ